MLDGIHPGEVEGKEASLALRPRPARRQATPTGCPSWCSLVVPLFNPDGNDALDPRQPPPRPQEARRPAGSRSWARAPRARASTSTATTCARPRSRCACCSRACASRGRPTSTIDNHATNGSVHRFHMTVDVPHTVESGRAEPIALMREPPGPRRDRGGPPARLRERVVRQLRRGRAGARRRTATSTRRPPVGLGWMTYPHHPRFGSNYRGLTQSPRPAARVLQLSRRSPSACQTASAWQIETLYWAAQHADGDPRGRGRERPPPERVAVALPHSSGSTGTDPTS